MTVSRYHLGLLLFLLPHSQRAIVAGVSDVLNAGSNITDGNTLVSAGESFTLGFFSPKGLTNRYLGIWFSVSNDSVCWVANRERPLNNTSGVLVFRDTGNLLLLDGSGQTVWASNYSSDAPAVAQLLESGNLVVREQSGKQIVWQSFDYPSDSLLPGMKMGSNMWKGTDWHLSSWFSPNDPSPKKNYRQIIQVNGLPDSILWKNTTKAYRSGPWNGVRFSGITEVGTYANMFDFYMIINPAEVSFMYTAKPGAPLSRIMVTEDGHVQRLVWEASSRNWEPFFTGPRDLCDDYAKCGPFGLCNINAASTSFCSCVKGFNPLLPSRWSMTEASHGCRRSVALDCAQGNGSSTTTDWFFVLQGVKLPDTYIASVNTSITLEECRVNCLANCSCVAYAPANIKVGAIPGCIIWTGNIIDLRYVDGGQDLYLRLAKSELAEMPHPPFPTAQVIGVLISAILLLILFVAIVIRRLRRRPGISDNGWTFSDAAVAYSRFGPGSNVWSVPAADLLTIKDATGNFSECNIIGQGGFGDVYEGQLPDGRKIAVKRLRQSCLTDKGKEDFTREVEVMSRLTHVNLVKLLYHCQEGDEWILVYEYMHNKSLSFYIFGQDNVLRSSLNWAQRLEIIRGIAIGVAYLHDAQVIHRDLKPCNILLDDTWKPKIADFGTAKLFIDDQTDPTLVLTMGYVAPEYAVQGYLTLKCDVYSFGVVLLEIVNGRRNRTGPTFLPDIWESWNHGEIRDLLDPEVAEPGPELLLGLARCIQVGLLCVQSAPEERPAMCEVVAMLTYRSSELAMPKKPMVSVGTGPAFWEADLRGTRKAMQINRT